MRGDFTLKILEIIKDVSYGTSDLIIAFLNSGYGASYFKLDRELDKLQRKREINELKKEERHRFYNLLYKLSREGLIARTKEDKWEVRKKGIEKFEALKSRSNTNLPDRKYKLQRNTEITIVAFDIPEIYRSKRDWLRKIISSLGFSKIQKSVWIGKAKLPEQLIEDLHKANILPYLEIFTINKKGTIKEIS